MFNAYIDQGFVLKQWEGVNIIPIQKVSHPKELSGYRPILLSITTNNIPANSNIK